jgi:hypothetical protein
MEKYIKDLGNLYASKNILINGIDVLLHENCVHKDNCWNSESINKRGDRWNKIAFPYIGDEYNGDLMCIGLNLHEYGGKGAQNELIKGNAQQIGVINYLKKGIKLINFNSNNYPGTIIFHRIAVYSNIILNNSICPNDNKKLSEIYSKIVFLEAIKCSPALNKSRPEPEMNNYCPNDILLNEIDILKPKRILILGNLLLNILKNKYKVIGESIYSKHGNIEIFNIVMKDDIIKIYKIIHPTAYGGNRVEIYQELFNAINNI